LSLDIVLQPIGYVQNGLTSRPPGGWRETVARVELDARFEPHLDGLGEFSHAVVIYWMHECRPEDREVARVHPRSRADLPLVGVFATRSQHRPNPLGLTVVEILSIVGTTLTVRGLDALDGSPVLDIKAYAPVLDDRRAGRHPAWVDVLAAETATGSPPERGDTARRLEARSTCRS
jgi:tRNA-Thr(GGU) m(6)t(6)A37 methyltransferase TsaA